MLNDCKCPICKGRGERCFEAEVLGKYSAQYHLCDQCGYLWINEPHWLEEAYSKAIASTDTGLVLRNVDIAGKLSAMLLCGLKERGEGKYLDASGGYGLLVRLMRDSGFDFYWQDKYCQNILAQGFEYSDEIGVCKAVTAFEVLEHVEDPVQYIKDALDQSGACTFVFTTELLSGQPPEPGAWWYYALESGQHIGFFQKRTLEHIAKLLGMKFVSFAGIHVFSTSFKSSIGLRLMTSRLGRLFAPIFARKMLGSKTVADSDVMAQLIRRPS